MELKGKQALVVGLARTGVAVVKFLGARGARVVATDTKPAGELETVFRETAGLPVAFHLGGHRREDFRESDLIVVSPGVPMDLPELAAARGEGKEIIAEIELAYRALTERGSRAPILAVTGANGKTTVTTLLGQIMSGPGRKVFVGGNIGKPLIEALLTEEDFDCLVVEVSSFQLEWVTSFRPRVGILMNITEDHLDRYASFSNYAWAKGRLFAFQTPEDFVVANREDPVVLQTIEKARGQKYFFSYHREVERGSFIRKLPGGKEEVVFRDEKREKVFPLPPLTVAGVHFRENVLAAFTASQILDLPGEAALARMAGFQGLPHRMELFATWRGIQFVDDSKATNVGAVERALQSYPSRSVILIAGGKDKGGDYRVISDLVRERVILLLLIGEATEKIAAAWGNLTECRKMGTLPEAVQAAVAAARPGNVILLSPACSSFDQFKNYEERGEVFRREAGKFIHD